MGDGANSIIVEGDFAKTKLELRAGTAEAKAEEKPATAPAHSAGEEHHSGPAGGGPLFEYGLTFNYNGDEARVWAHPRAANAGPRALVILLHGLNESGDKHPSLAANAGK